LTGIIDARHRSPQRGLIGIRTICKDENVLEHRPDSRHRIAAINPQ
jgi:hypothetical protein